MSLKFTVTIEASTPPEKPQNYGLSVLSVKKEIEVADIDEAQEMALRVTQAMRIIPPYTDYGTVAEMIEEKLHGQG